MPLIFEHILNYTYMCTGNHGKANAGIYIWGFALPSREEIKKIIDDVNKMKPEDVISFKIKKIENTKVCKNEIFCPLNVGETNGKICERIHTHYNSEAFTKTVLFDLSLHLPCVYAGIKSYNYHWIRRGRSRNLNTLHLNVNVNVNLHFYSFLFFSNPQFYTHVFPGIILPPGFLAWQNVSQRNVIHHLPNIFPGVIDFKKKLLISQIILKRFFRFTYAILQPPNVLKNYEAATKWALEQLGLFTIAHMHDDGPCIHSLLNSGLTPLGGDTIDFNNVGQIYNPFSIARLLYYV